MKYVIEYTDDFTRQKRNCIVEHTVGATWREIQKKFDPNYHWSNVRIFLLGEEIKLKEGE